MYALKSEKSIISSVFAVSVLFFAVCYGLAFRPFYFGASALSLEIIFFLSSVVVILQALFLGHSTTEILFSISRKLIKALPIIFLLFLIGVLIGSWMISGTIPMLVFLGLNFVSAEYIYLAGFIVPIIFSLCIGSSWSTIATIGLVIITVGDVLGAELAILTGAIVGGAYFGDKLSPLSDTTNIAAIASGVNVQSHIKAMLKTTLPAALIAMGLYIYIGFSQPVSGSLEATNSLQLIQQNLDELFVFSPLLLLPPLIILAGTIGGYKAIPALTISIVLGFMLAVIVQDVSADNIYVTFKEGFRVDMVATADVFEGKLLLENLLNRGGLYALIEPIVITILVFVYVGTIDQLNAIQSLISRGLSSVEKTSTLVATTLFSSAMINALTSSQYANSFIVGEAFQPKYDEVGISKTVLSRSLEDTGTMIESLVPWSTTAVFVGATLGVSVNEYWQYQFLSLANVLIAFLFAFCISRFPVKS